MKNITALCNHYFININHTEQQCTGCGLYRIYNLSFSRAISGYDISILRRKLGFIK